MTRSGPQIHFKTRACSWRRARIAARLQRFRCGDLIDKGGREKRIETAHWAGAAVRAGAFVPIGGDACEPVGGAATDHDQSTAFHVPNGN